MPTKRSSSSSSSKKTTRETFRISTNEIVAKVKELLHEGNVRRIVIQNEEGKTLMEIPLSFALIGTVIAPALAAVGALAGVITNCRLIVERREDE